MNKKAQLDEINMAAAGLAILGGFIAALVAGYGGAGIGIQLISAVLTTILCYFIVARD